LCLPDYHEPALKEKFNNVVAGIGLDDLQQYVSDIGKSWKVLLITLGVAIFTTVLYTVLLRYQAEVLVWISIIAVIGGFGGLGYFAYDYADAHYPATSNDSARTWIKVGAYVCWALTGLMFLMMLCFYRSIQISIAVVKASAHYISNNMHVIIVPVLSFVVTILFIVAWIASAVTLFSVGDIEPGHAGGLVKTVHWSSTTRYLMIYQLFGLLWIVAMILACTSFVIIGSVCMWYFSFNSDTKASSSILTSIGWIFRYHMGSLAFGSFLIALIWLVRIIFEYLEKKMKAGGGAALDNPFTRCVTCCCRCCLDCCNRFVKYINENAYA